MKEENKYVTILKVLLFVSLISLFISAFVDFFDFYMSYYAGFFIFEVSKFEKGHMIILVLFMVILLGFIIVYGLHLFSSNNKRLPVKIVFVLSAISALSSFAFFAITILMHLFGYLLGVSYFPILLALYSTEFAISLLILLLYLGDFRTFLRERLINRNPSK